MDVHTHNKAQKFPTVTNKEGSIISYESYKYKDFLSTIEVLKPKLDIELKKNEKINLPTVGPGPMTASAVITDCGIYEKQMTFLNAPLDQLKDV